jgi:N,N'-diacetyllegionaminate synthase
MHTFIIAEAGVNHNGDLNIAKRMIDAAKEAGADAIKFQTFKASEIVTMNSGKAQYQIDNTGNSESQYEMLKALELSPEDHKILKNYCDCCGILFMSTPFDIESVNLLESLGVPLYKVASGEITNLPLLREIAKKGKPIILSTGMSTMTEIEEALASIYNEGNRDVTVLHCTTNYPTPYNEVNLNAMITLRDALNVKVGYSDHTKGIEVSIAAVALGAEVIEKHFTLDRSLPGPDHIASIEPAELKEMVSCIRNIEAALGDGRKTLTDSERVMKQGVRKSVTAKREIKMGEIIRREDLCIKRPAGGIEPKYLDNLAGRRAKNDIRIDSTIYWSDIEH